MEDTTGAIMGCMCMVEFQLSEFLENGVSLK